MTLQETNHTKAAEALSCAQVVLSVLRGKRGDAARARVAELLTQEGQARAADGLARLAGVLVHPSLPAGSPVEAAVRIDDKTTIAVFVDRVDVRDQDTTLSLWFEGGRPADWLIECCATADEEVCRIANDGVAALTTREMMISSLRLRVLARQEEHNAATRAVIGESLFFPCRPDEMSEQLVDRLLAVVEAGNHEAQVAAADALAREVEEGADPELGALDDLNYILSIMHYI